MTWFWYSIGLIVSSLIGVDARRNPQSYRNLRLRAEDGYRNLRLWPGRLSRSIAYYGRHRRDDPIPSFMRSWQPPRPWRA